MSLPMMINCAVPHKGMSGINTLVFTNFMMKILVKINAKILPKKFPAFGGKIFPDFQKNIDREIFLEFQVVSIDRSWTAEQIQKYYRPYRVGQAFSDNVC